jgi:hypothetical protein
MNKGFILDGYPRKTEDAVQIFLKATDTEIPETEQIPGYPTYQKNQKIIP